MNLKDLIAAVFSLEELKVTAKYDVDEIFNDILGHAAFKLGKTEFLCNEVLKLASADAKTWNTLTWQVNGPR